VRGLARAVDAFKTDKQTCLCHSPLFCLFALQF
jgi:hypothetical protein